MVLVGCLLDCAHRMRRAAPSALKSKLSAADATVLHLTNVKINDRLRHSKFAESSENRATARRAIGFRPDAYGYNVGLGDGLGIAVAGAFGAVGRVAATTITRRFPIGNSTQSKFKAATHKFEIDTPLRIKPTLNASRIGFRKRYLQS